jgi:hypothetical protein
MAMMARTWRRLPSDAAITIHAPGRNGADGRRVHAVVMGQSGLVQGLAVSEDDIALEIARSGDLERTAGSTGLSVMFNEGLVIIRGSRICTTPVKVSRAQQILYGPTLHGHLHGRQIGAALLAEGSGHQEAAPLPKTERRSRHEPCETACWRTAPSRG